MIENCLLATVGENISLANTLLTLVSAAIGGIAGVVAYKTKLDYQHKEIKKEIELLRDYTNGEFRSLRRDTKNAVIHVESKVQEVRAYLHETTKNDPNIRTFETRQSTRGHTGADFLSE